MNLSRWLKEGQEVQAARLNLPLELEDGQSALRGQRLLWIGSGVILFFLLWSSVTPVRELALAPGELSPPGQVRTIQHLEGGIVAEIGVRDGAAVKAGQVIIQLSPHMAESDLAALQLRRTVLSQQHEQIKALLSGSAPAFQSSGQVSRDQAAIHESRGAMRVAERHSLISRIEQRRAALQGLRSELVSLERLAKISEEQAKIRQDLASQGYMSRRSLLEAQATLEQYRQRIAATTAQAVAAKEALAEAESELSRVTADARRLLSEELAKVNADLAEADETLRKFSDRVTRLAVRAPVDGIVLQIMPRSVGEVVRSGEPIARFVPSAEALVADVRIRPADIGHVKIGDRVELRVSTFDARVFGKVKGELSSVSATTLQGERGDPYFRGLVKLDSYEMSGGGRNVTLLPGMTVDSEIITGSKTLLLYMLRPFHNTITSAFTER